MNLCRVLPAGLEAKACVDAAVAACNAIGNLRGDILRCKQAAEASGSEEGERGGGGEVEGGERGGRSSGASGARPGLAAWEPGC